MVAVCVFKAHPDSAHLQLDHDEARGFGARYA